MTIVETLSIMNSDLEGSLALKGMVISNVSSNEKMISTTLRESNPKSFRLDSSVISVSGISACCARILTIPFSMFEFELQVLLLHDLFLEVVVYYDLRVVALGNKNFRVVVVVVIH